MSAWNEEKHSLTADHKCMFLKYVYVARQLAAGEKDQHMLILQAKADDTEQLLFSEQAPGKNWNKQTGEEEMVLLEASLCNTMYLGHN